MRSTIEMAREAGFFEDTGDGQGMWMANISCLKAFEAFVRADERLKVETLQVAPSIVDAYCAAWEQSFLADNPFDTVHLTDALKKHVEAGLKAALAKARGETQ
jgi:hypothetical protein